MTPFKTPSEVHGPAEGETYVKFKDLVGELLIIAPTAYEQDIPSTHAYAKPGDTYDRVTADVIVVDIAKPKKSDLHENVWIDKGRIIGKTKRMVGTGEMLLATLTREGTEASSPYDLADPTPAEVKAAEVALAAVGKSSEQDDAPPF